MNLPEKGGRICWKNIDIAKKVSGSIDIYIAKKVSKHHKNCETALTPGIPSIPGL